MSPKQDDIVRRLEAIDNSFLDAMEEDDRLRSGVPEHQRGTDLDFIQMTGLTRQALGEETSGPSEAPVQDFAGADALSFFEKGVADVDAAMTPPAFENGADQSKEILRESHGLNRPASASPLIADLREVIEELVREESASASESDEVESAGSPASEAAPEEESEIAVPVTSAGSSTFEAELVPASSSDAFERVPESDSAAPPVSPSIIRATEGGNLSHGVVSSMDPVEWVVTEDVQEETEGREGFAPLVDTDIPQAAPEFSQSERPDVEHRVDLGAAEELLRALESQPREPAPAESAPSEPPGLTFPVESPLTPGLASPAQGPETDEDEDTGDERDLSIYRQPLTKHGRRGSGRHRSRGWRRLVSWGTRVAVVLIIGGAGIGAYVWFRPMLATPQETFERAKALQADARYADACETFQRFAEGNPDHVQHAEAQFLAAYCLQLAPADSFDAKQARNTRALDLLDRFVKDNPAHAKVPRARIRMGILDFEIGRYENAIELLQDPTLPQRDPEGALPALRTLARARLELGQYKEAASAYLQAASLTGNYTADQDYEALGDLYRLQADHVENGDERRQLQTEAVESWTKALRMPTADPAATSKIREKRRWLSDQLGISGDETADQVSAPKPQEKAAPPGPTPSQPAIPRPEAPKAEQQTTAAAVPAPVSEQQTKAGGVAPDPRAEANYPGAGVDSGKTGQVTTVTGGSSS